MLAAIVAIAPAGCGTGPATPTGPVEPGSSTAPRDVNLIAKDYLFIPPVVELVPGETVLLHVVNGGLAIHEAVIGDQAVQDAWEAAEAATVGAPPGPTPEVRVPPEAAGLRVIVASGERRDVLFTVPDGTIPGGPGLIIGCHIPGHYAKGMYVPVRLVPPG